MIDTLNLSVWRSEQDYELSKIADSLNDVRYSKDMYDGREQVGGRLVGEYSHDLKVYANNNVLTIKDRSIAKWFNGDNLGQFTRRDCQQAISVISDVLHIDMMQARVTRFDMAENICMARAVGEYLQRCAMLRGKMPLDEVNGLRYPSTYSHLILYDKLAEMKANREYVSEFWNGANVLRIERQYDNPTRYFKCVGGFRVKDLLDKEFYAGLAIDLKNDLYEIVKQPILNEIDMESVFEKGVKGLQVIGVHALVAKCGGVDNFMFMLEKHFGNSAYERNQKSRIKKYVTECLSYDSNDASMVDEVIEELNEMIANLQVR